MCRSLSHVWLYCIWLYCMFLYDDGVDITLDFLMSSAATPCSICFETECASNLYIGAELMLTPKWICDGDYFRRALSMRYVCIMLMKWGLFNGELFKSIILICLI